MTSPIEFHETKLAAFEKFVVLLYDRTCSEASVDAARIFLFTRKGRQIEAIPPTRAALFQHTKRAIHQAGFIWGSNASAISRCAIAKFMGMDKKSHEMGAALDGASRSCVLFRTASMLMQKGSS